MPHALIVDHDSSTSQLLSAVTHAEGYTSAIVDNLRNAVLQSVAQPPDIVFIDDTMPNGMCDARSDANHGRRSAGENSADKIGRAHV